MIITWIYKFLLLVATLLGLRWIYRIYAKQDGNPRMSLREFQQFASFILFYGSYIFILIIESRRPSEAHVFDALWFAMVITGLFSVLHMEDVLEKVRLMLETIIKLRTKTASQPEPPTTVPSPPPSDGPPLPEK